MKTSDKTMTKTVTKDIFLKQMLDIQNIYLVCIGVYHSYHKEEMSKNVTNFLLLLLFVCFLMNR